MSALKRFLKDTVIYGLATVLPRLMNFILVPLHTEKLGTVSYSENTTFYVYAAFFNVLLTYGMETAFFRFFSKHQDQKRVYSTVLISLTVTTLIFLATVWSFNGQIADMVGLRLDYFNYLLGVLVLDTLVVAPFAYLRATNRPIKFASIKIANIVIYVLLNFFFLWAIPKFSWEFSFYEPEHLVQYIFIANLAASAFTFLLVTPYIIRTELVFQTAIFRELIKYGLPIMVAGLAFVINENLDKLLIKDMIDEDTMGAYAGCYKLAVFMTIFIQAFRLGAEPFFFNHAKEKNAKETYAIILKYFVITGSIMLLGIVAYLDWLKPLIVRDESFWKAIAIVPIVLLANLCLGIYHNLSIWYKLTDKTRYGMYISIMGAIVTVVFNVVMIPVLGFMASAWATLAAYGGMMIISYLLGRKHYPVPYDLKRIALYLLIAVLMSAVSFHYLRGQYLMNTLFVFVFLSVIFFAERRELIRIIKR
ncbi:oligosaccharide flippase family protein [Sungkyunkwania multivorans]|uniref:Oligosaccharide flippase family protein n=1 Tax=Sungkyunkwania multivorans TaxID=1173618 RepID=A0ABW3CZ31_9FLAO